jgi:hypothetical protein
MSENPDQIEKLEAERRSTDDMAERRFNETVRNLLNTPHKPHRQARLSDTPEKPVHAKEKRARRIEKSADRPS